MQYLVGDPKYPVKQVPFARVKEPVTVQEESTNVESEGQVCSANNILWLRCYVVDEEKTLTNAVLTVLPTPITIGVAVSKGEQNIRLQRLIDSSPRRKILLQRQDTARWNNMCC